MLCRRFGGSKPVPGSNRGWEQREGRREGRTRHGRSLWSRGGVGAAPASAGSLGGALRSRRERMPQDLRRPRGESVVRRRRRARRRSDHRGCDTAAARGGLRAVVACAGGARAMARTVGRDGWPHDRELFEETVSLNLVGTFNTLRLAAAAMAALEPVDDDGQRGAFVSVASIAGYEGQIGQLAYGAAKAGVIGMTLIAARDLAAQGIRVNCIAPGTIRTKAWDARTRRDGGVPQGHDPLSPSTRTTGGVRGSRRAPRSPTITSTATSCASTAPSASVRDEPDQALASLPEGCR